MRSTIASTSVVVLPVPGPASTSSGPPVVVDDALLVVVEHRRLRGRGGPHQAVGGPRAHGASPCHPGADSRLPDMTRVRRPAGRSRGPRPDPRPGRTAGRADARRHGRPGDQGRVGDRRRHPRVGAAVGGRPRARRPARLDVLHERQPQQGVDRPRPQGRRRPRRAGEAGRALRRAAGELPHRRARPPRLPGRAAARAQPRPGDRLDQRVRARRPGGRPGGLRPDRPGRGRADEPDRRGRADQGGRADRRPAGRDEPRVRRPGRAARTRCGPDVVASCVPRCSRGSSGCTPSRAPAGPSPARCRG